MMNLDAVIRADWQFRSEQAARTFPIGAYERMSGIQAEQRAVNVPGRYAKREIDSTS
jgi:hypothetical protein